MALIEIGKTGLGQGDRIEFFRALSNWLQSGAGQMSTSEAIKFTCESFSRDEYRTLQPRMYRIISSVEMGTSSFAEALYEARLGFTEQEISIVRAAEKSNQLRQALPSLVTALEVKQKARKSLMGKLAMPLVGGVMLILMSIGVMTFMMPMVLGPVLQRDPTALDNMPFVIGWYWELSQWFQIYWRMVAFGAAVGVVLIIFRNHSILKPYSEKVIMAFAPFRRLIVAFNATLVVYFMPALLRSGLPPHQVLRALADTLDTLSISSALRMAANEYEGGTQLVDALQGLPFRSSFRSSVESGEKTGAIADRVEDLQRPYMGDLERVINQTVAGLTMLVMALLLPLFLLSMYITLTVPIFALMEY